MASTFDNNLRLREMGTGDESGTWGARTNENLELIGEAFGFGTEAVSGTTHTTTIANGATDPGRAMYLKYTGSLSSACTITLAPDTISKLWFIENATSGSQNIIIKQGSGATITIPASSTKLVYSDGAGSGAAIVDALDKIDLGTNAKLNDSGIASANSTTTLINKSIDSDNNTITNIADADIKSTAAIAFSKLADLTASRALVSDSNGDVSVSAVTSAELGYLDGVTSAIQTQINTIQTQVNAKLNQSLPVGTTLSSTDSKERFQFVNNSHTYYGSGSGHYFRYNGATRLSLDSSGNLTAVGNVGAYSDMALKEDIYEIENALDKVKKLRGVHFTKKADKSKEIGVVANEVEKVVPELVDEVEDEKLGTIKTMKYANTVGLLIEAVKDLSKQVEELKNGSTN